MLIKYFLNFIFLFLVLGQFSLFRGVYLFDLFIFMFNLLVIFKGLYIKNLKIPESFFGYLYLVIFMAIGIILNYKNYNSHQVLISSLYAVRFLNYVIFGISVYNLIRWDCVDIGYISRLIHKYSYFFIFLGILQLLFFPDFELLDKSLGWDPHKNRLSSTFFDPNFAGAFLNISLLNLIYLHKTRYKNIKVLMIIFAIVLTFSRSSWLFLFVTTFVYSYYKNRWFFILALVLGFCAYFFVPRIQTRISGITDVNDSARFRIISYKNAIEVFNLNRFYGVSYNAYGFAQLNNNIQPQKYTIDRSLNGADSSFLLILATTGVIGFMIFVFSYFFPLSVSYSRLEYKLLMKSLILGLFFQTQFINAFFYPQISSMFFLLIGLSSCFVLSK